MIAAACVASVALVALAMNVRRLPLPAGLVLAIGGLTYPLYLLHQHIGYMLLNKFQNLASAPVLIATTALVNHGRVVPDLAAVREPRAEVVQAHVNAPGRRIGGWTTSVTTPVSAAIKLASFPRAPGSRRLRLWPRATRAQRPRLHPPARCETFALGGA